MPYRRLHTVLFFLVLFCALPALAAPRKVVRVPRDAKDLQTAIKTVKDGDVIELAAGTYAPPPKGFTIQNVGKAFTIRAAAGATVILDGKGKGTILLVKASRGKRVTFERLTFQNGVSTAEGTAGAVTLNAALARFVDCRFLNNSASGRTTGGGAVRAISGTDATFVRTEWRGNSSKNRGGAVEILFSTVAVEGGSLVENRTNPPGAKTNSQGGAIYVLDSTLRVSDARFERNQAAFVGGAVYAFGTWSQPASVAKADLTVVRSTFVDNQTCCSATGQGGAFHVEDQTTLRLQHSHLIGNRAKLGGAVSNYRAVVEVTGSLFDANRAFEGAALGSGGAIFASSNEFARDGAVNRRPIIVTIADSLLKGSAGVPAAGTGGCVTAGGDVSRAYGANGASQMGTVDENRARMEVRRSVFLDCDVQSSTGAGFGGRINAALANLLTEESLFMQGDARGSNAGGGGIAVQDESLATILRTTFAHNSADRSGGGLLVLGSTVHVNQSRFFGNDIRSGVPEGVNDSRGAAISTSPTLVQRPRNAGGLVENSLFSENAGLAVFDTDPASPATNQVRYTNNQFHETAFGDKIYGNSRSAASGVNVAGMNRIKSHSGNLRLASPPVAGTLLAAPSVVGTGAPSAAGTFLHFAWSGRSASLNGQALTTRAGQVPAGAGTHSLVVDGTQAAIVFLGSATCANGAACLAGGRFVVRVEGASLLAREADTAFFSLSGGETLAVQVLDRRDKNGHFWVARGVSNVSGVPDLSGHSLEITDTATGATRTWSFPLSGNDAEVDFLAFPAF